MSQQPDEEAIFHVARTMTDPEVRSTYLDQICAGDQALRDRVLELLGVHDQESEFLKSSHQDLPTTDSSPVKVKAGEHIGRYKLLQKIGEGGFGVVYMAEQVRPVRRKVALKIIKPGMDTNAVVARFEAERQALAMMDHPNIAQVHDGGATENGRPYFVMELVKGVPITEFCDKNQFSTDERLRLFMNVCQAVQHAHQKGIIHRDIKPSNVLVTLADGQPIVKVIDFGVAKATNQQLTERTLFTAFGQMVGTPQYMSPEQAEMSCLDVDTRSDVYSLAVLLYELLTGTTPIRGERLRSAGYVEMQRIIQEEEPPKPSTRLTTIGDELCAIARHRSVAPDKLRRQVQGDLDLIVMKALEKDRSKRFETASAFSAEVGRFLENEPLSFRPPSTWQQFENFYRRNKTAVTTFGGIFAALAVGTSLAVWGLIRAENEASNAKLEQKRASDALTTLQDVVVQQAMSTALSGNVDRTHQLLQLGQDAKVDASDLGLVRAVEAYVSGKPDQSIDLLAPVFEKDRNNVSALGLAAMAHAAAGRDDGHLEYLGRLDGLQPISAEDHLLVGRATIDREQSLRLVSKAFELRPTPTSLLFKAESINLWANDKGRPLEARKALKYTEAAELFLGETSYSLAVRLVSHHLLAKHTKERESSTHVENAMSAAKRLLGASDDLFKWVAAVFYADIGEYELALDAWQNVEVENRVHSQYIASLLHRYESDPTIALTHFDRLTQRDRQNPYVRISRLALATEADSMNHKRAVVEELIETTSDVPQMQWLLTCTCFQLGEASLQKELAQRLSSTATNRFDAWGMRDAIDFLAGEPTDERIQAALSRVGNSRERECLLRGAIAQRLLLDSERRDEAIEQLQKCLDTDAWYFFEYNWVRSYLYRLQSDPNWPLWSTKTGVDK